jgi:hypothetical protein
VGLRGCWNLIDTGLSSSGNKKNLRLQAFNGWMGYKECKKKSQIIVIWQFFSENTASLGVASL